MATNFYSERVVPKFHGRFETNKTQDYKWLPAVLGWQRSNLWNIGMRFVQVILASTVVGLYGKRLKPASEANVYMDSKWVYATVVGSFSLISAILFMFTSYLNQYRAISLLWVWEIVLFILWIPVVGISQALYANANWEMQGAAVIDWYVSWL
ncbi:hypothetical protein LTR66_015074 [Elasticomyces elasticus]|nr:hypothetical protein LTR66_015074 [Elasticomyces elasticus]